MPALANPDRHTFDEIQGLVNAFLPLQPPSSPQPLLQAGEALWDRSASDQQALAISCSEFLNRLQAFQSRTAGLQQAHREVELVLGICANLATNVATRSDTLATGAVHQILQTSLLLHTEPQCLAEACRLALASLQASAPQQWLRPEPAALLHRLVWIAANTLYQVLLDRCPLNCRGAAQYATSKLQANHIAWATLVITLLQQVS